MEVQLNANNSPSNNPFNINEGKEVIQLSTTKSPDPSTNNQSINESFTYNNDCNLKIRVNANNSIIQTNRDVSTSTPDNDTSPFTLQAKVIYKGTRATIVNIIR